MPFSDACLFHSNSQIRLKLYLFLYLSPSPDSKLLGVRDCVLFMFETLAPGKEMAFRIPHFDPQIFTQKHTFYTKF